jgi:hypothetical protein
MRLWLAVITGVFCSAVTAMYVGAGVEPSPAVQTWLAAGPPWMMILWMCQDARRKHIAAVTDLGFFLMLFWPIVIPWYVFNSRGRAGWKLLLGLAALVLATPVTGIIVWILQNGRR